ncbi:hypothetical protein A2U01_0061521 [Trifolium medium]|uniref:Uncharacterized protein n=1 Tax=Trifolium medium TaxID=97028 RepID=A0A392RUH3_9FABA|nr:hypothetical protein [Trifolium medium]
MTNDNYRQHGASTHLALSNRRRPNQVLRNPDRGKLSTKACTEIEATKLGTYQENLVLHRSEI